MGKSRLTYVNNGALVISAFLFCIYHNTHLKILSNVHIRITESTSSQKWRFQRLSTLLLIGWHPGKMSACCLALALANVSSQSYGDDWRPFIFRTFFFSGSESVWNLKKIKEKGFMAVDHFQRIILCVRETFLYLFISLQFLLLISWPLT